MIGPSRTFSLEYYVARNGRNYYGEFLQKLDSKTGAQIQAQVTKLAAGIGKVRSLDNKLWELKVDIGPGYRVLFTRRGNEIVLILAAADKSTQKRTITLAGKLLREIELEIE